MSLTAETFPPFSEQEGFTVRRAVSALATLAVALILAIACQRTSAPSALISGPTSSAACASGHSGGPSPTDQPVTTPTETTVPSGSGSIGAGALPNPCPSAIAVAYETDPVARTSDGLQEIATGRVVLKAEDSLSRSLARVSATPGWIFTVALICSDIRWSRKGARNAYPSI